jgi:hypothetical protein
MGARADEEEQTHLPQRGPAVTYELGLGGKGSNLQLRLQRTT